MDTDVPPILLPCAICARTFMPQSLEKHSKICQQSANKRRRPFDSAKQRIRGTELAEFLPRQEKKRHLSDDKSSKATSTWKQTHDDFLEAIRAARNEVVVPGMQKQGGTTVTPNAPTRPNEQGICPTCSRHFGVKAYDRHVAWCKERIVRVTASPATNVAKERLDARMNYRAPAARNRRQTTREKYSPGSAITLTSGNKTSPTLVAARAKESVSAPSCNKNSDSLVKQKIAVVRRSGQAKESSNLAVPMKYRSMDRGNRPPEDEAGPITFRPVKRISQLPVPPLKHTKVSLEECDSIPSSRSSRKQPRRTRTNTNRDDNSKVKMKQDEKYQALQSARSQKANIVSARSQGNPKVNDVSINEEMMGVTVKPCYIYKNQSQLTTWRQISEGKDSAEMNCKLGCNERNAKDQNASPNNNFLDRNEESVDRLSLYKEQLKNVELALGEEVLKEEPGVPSLESDCINWPPTTPSLNRTYSFRESVINGDVDDVEIARNKRWKPVKHSPRVEFCLGDPEKVSRVYAPPIGFGYPDARAARNDVKNSGTKLKEKSVEATCSKHFASQADRALDKVPSAKEDFNSGALLLKSKSSTEHFEASSDRVLRATSCEDIPRQTSHEDNDQSCDNVEATTSQMYSKENNMTGAVSSNRECTVKETNLMDEILEPVAVTSGRSMDAIEVSEKETLSIKDRPSNGNLRSSTSFERFACVSKVEDFFETSEPEWNNNVVNNNDTEETNGSMVDNIQLDSEEIEDCNNLKRGSEVFVIDKESSVQSVQNGIECPAVCAGNNEDMEFCDTETNWIETEIEPEIERFSTNDTSEPTRSSTPFVGKTESSYPKCDAYENFKKELYRLPERSEWKMEVDTETGSEMLYRSESRGSNCSSSRLSSRSKIDKLDKSNSDNDTVQSRNRSSSKRSKSNKLNKSPERISGNASPTVQTERRIFSRIATSVSQEKRENDTKIGEESPRTYRKEIASQTNICNGSLKMCSNYICERSVDEVCIDQARNKSRSEEQVRDTLLTNNAPDTETVNKSINVQTEQTINETNLNSERKQSSVDRSNVTWEQGDHDRNKVYVNAEGYNNSSKPSKFSMKSTDVTKAMHDDIEEIYKNCSNQDFDRDSDNSIERHIKDAISGLKYRSVRNEKVQQNVRNLRSFVVSESCVKMRQRVRVDDSLTSRSTALKSRRCKKLEMENRSSEHVGGLNGSSDSLPSSMGAIDLTDMKQVESVEVETIEEIGTRNRSIRLRILPEIKGTAVVVKDNCNEKEKINTQMYWEKASKASRNRLINLDPPYQGQNRLFKRNPKIRVLPPVPSNSSLIMHRDLKLPLRPVWSNYVRRRPDFNLVLSGRTGKDYDPFLLAEQQMNDLLSDTSEQSVTDSRLIEKNRDSSFPLSHSSAFVKYPGQSSLSNPEKRSSLIAPPTEFDDLTSDFSSDSTETNSLSREVFRKDLKGSRESNDSISKPDVGMKSPVKELGRRVIVDKSKALGGEVIDDSSSRGSRSYVCSTDRGRKILDKLSPKVVRPAVNRSLSIRAASAPKVTQDRKSSNSSREKRTADDDNNDGQRSATSCLNSRNNNYANLSSSNLSLSSIVSSDVDIKRSNSVFDELMTSFEDENGSFASLKTLLKNDSLSVSSPVHGRYRNGQISDEELSSPESYKRQDHSKMSADSAYSSLNRKYSHHGRSTSDVAGRFDDDVSRNNRREGNGVASAPKCKMSKFCHECGSKFPETAKFCCECGIRRLVL